VGSPPSVSVHFRSQLTIHAFFPSNQQSPLSRNPLFLAQVAALHHPIKPPQLPTTPLNINKMATKEDFEKTGASAAQVHRIRITLTSRNVQNLENCRYSCSFCLNVVSYSDSRVFFFSLVNISLPGSHQPGQGQGPPCQGSR
jgi:hypothetical protein